MRRILQKESIDLETQIQSYYRPINGLSGFAITQIVAMNTKISCMSKLALVCFFSTLLGCQTEDLAVESQNSDSAGIHFKQIPLTDLGSYNPKTLLALQKILQSSKGRQSVSRGLNAANTYAIDSSSITAIDNGNGYESFTFRVITDTQADYIQNIVISNYADGSVNSYLAEYTLSTTAAQVHEEQINSYITGSTFYNLAGATISYAKGGGADLCVDTGYYTYVDKCNGELVTPGESPQCFNADGTRAQKKVFVILASTCAGGGSPESPGTNLGDGISNPGMAPVGGGGNGTIANPGSGGGTPVTNPTPGNTNPTQSEITNPDGTTIITTPIALPPPVNHINELNKLTANKADGTKTNIKAKIDELKAGLATAAYEGGAMYNSAQTPRAPDIVTIASTEWLNVPKEYYITLHRHQDKYIRLGGTVREPTNPIQSDTDVANLLKLHNYTNNKNATALLVSRLGTFAIRVTDRDKANDAYNRLMTNSNDRKIFGDNYDDKVLSYLTSNPRDENTALTGFISFVNTNEINNQTMGIAIYQAIYNESGNITNWIKL